MRTVMYREQHGRIRQKSRELEAMDASGSAPITIRLTLAALSGTVSAHLANEDASLYPRLLEHANADVREKAAAFQQSMGTLAGAFTAFYDHWKTPGAIEGDRAGFFAALRGVLRALRERMDLEDGDLYALADRELAA
jgi:Hemerythrin HHE cation binding domain